MDTEITAVLDRYKQNLIAMGLDVHRILLYGSRASGQPRVDSDMDLMVVSDSLAGLDLWERLALLGRARVGIDFPMEIQGMTREEFTRASRAGFVAEEILPGGIEVG